MDKQEYREFLDEIRRGYESGDYEMVASYADEIELGKIKEPKVLEMISDSYSRLGEYDLARGALLKARDRNSTSRQIAYKLSELSVQLGDLDAAVQYYEDFCRLAGNDSKRYILKYEIGRAGGIPTKELIKVLESYNSREKDERWEYELARLYHEAGEESKCVATCDDIFLWYADGEYVKKALELKFSHIALTPVQQQKYEEMMSDYIDPKPSWYQQEEPVSEAAEEPAEEEAYSYEPASVQEEAEEADEPEEAAESVVREDSPEIDETKVIPIGDIIDKIQEEAGEKEEAQERTSYTAVWASAAIKAAEAESHDEAEAEPAADEPEPAPEPEEIREEIAEEALPEEPAPVRTSKTSEITFDELRRMIHEGNSKKAAQGVFFTMEEPTEEDIAEEAAMKAARIAAAEEAARLAEEEERIAAEEEAARQAAIEEARLAAEIEANRLAEEGREAEKAAQMAELEQASSLLMAAAREASDDEDDDDEILEEDEELISEEHAEAIDAEVAENIAEEAETETEDLIEKTEDKIEIEETIEDGHTRVFTRKEVAAIIPEVEDSLTDIPSPEAAQAAGEERIRISRPVAEAGPETESEPEDLSTPVAEIVKRTESSPDSERLRRVRLRKIRNQNASEPELEETQFINRAALMDRLFASEEQAEEKPEKAEDKQAEDPNGATQVFSRQDILMNTVLDTVNEAADPERADAQERLGAAIEEILQDADAVLEVNSEETKTIRIVLSAASAAKLGITSAMLSPLAESVVKPDLVYISPNVEETQALMEAINSEFGTPRIIDNVDFSYIGLSRDDDGQMGINLDFLVREDDNIEGQITFFDVFDSYKEILEKNKDEVAAIEAERLRKIQEAVNLTAPITLPYAMEDMELDDIVITDLEGNEQEPPKEEFTLNLGDISLLDEDQSEADTKMEVTLTEDGDTSEQAEEADISEEDIEAGIETSEAEEPEEELEIPPWKLAYLQAEAAGIAASGETETAGEAVAEETEAEQAALAAEAEKEIPEEDDDFTPEEIEVTSDLSVEEILRNIQAEPEEPDEQEEAAEEISEEVTEATEGSEPETDAEVTEAAEEEPMADTQEAEEPEEEFEIPPWKLAYLQAEAAEQVASEAEAEETVDEEPAAEAEEAPAETETETEEVSEEAEAEEPETVKYEIPTWKIAQIMDAEAEAQAAQAEAEMAAAEEIAEEPEAGSEEATVEAEEAEPEEEPTEDKQETEEDIEAVQEDAAAAAIAEFERHYAEVMGDADDSEDLDELGDSLADLMGNEEAPSEETEEATEPEQISDVESAIAEFEKSVDFTSDNTPEEEIEGFDELGDSLAEMMSEDHVGEEPAEEKEGSEEVIEAEEEEEPEAVEAPEATEVDEPDTGSDETEEPEAEEAEAAPELTEEPERAEGRETEMELELEPETAEEDDDTPYALPADIREEISEFLLIDGMEDSICDAVGNILAHKKSGDATGGNLVITGDIKSGKTFLSIAVIKAVAEELQLGSGKVAKVQAELLNGKNMEKVFNKISGSDLIIENIGYLEDSTIRDITEVMKTGNHDSMVVLEGNQLAVENIFSNFPEFAALFKNRININELSIVQWADVAIDYADSQGYVLDDMAKLALHARINEINVPTDRLGYDKIIEIMDNAIEKAEKRNVGKLFAAFSSRKNANEKKEIIESDII